MKTQQLKGKSKLAQRAPQIAVGILLLAISALIILIALAGVTPEERDVTAIIFLAPLGLYLIFTKQIIM